MSACPKAEIARTTATARLTLPILHVALPYLQFQVQDTPPEHSSVRNAKAEVTPVYCDCKENPAAGGAR